MKDSIHGIHDMSSLQTLLTLTVPGNPNPVGSLMRVLSDDGVSWIRWGKVVFHGRDITGQTVTVQAYEIVDLPVAPIRPQPSERNKFRYGDLETEPLRRDALLGIQPKRSAR